MSTLKLEIVTPAAKIFSGDVEMVVVPGASGELGILPMHIALMTELKPGELKITQNNEETCLAVGAGFVEVTQDHVSVLTDMALQEKEIDEAAAEQAASRAQAALRESNLNAEEVAAVEASLAKSLAQLLVKRRKRHS